MDITTRTPARVLRDALLSRPAQLVTGPLVLILMWYVLRRMQVVDARLLPSPGDTFVGLYQSIFFGSMMRDVSRTLLLVLYSFGLAAVLGIPIGIVLGASAALYRRAEFLVDFFRSIPVTALFPLFMLMFGLTDFTKVTLAAFSACLIIIFNVAHGVLNARKTRILAARSMGASRWRIFRDVIFYETLPQTFVGLRTGISIALVVIVIAEMFIGANDGVGHRIIDAQMGYDLINMYGSILVAGVLGYGLNYFFIALEKLLIHWSGH